MKAASETFPDPPLVRFRHLLELDGIRGLAAFAVVLHHALYANLGEKSWPGLTGVFVNVASRLDIGVDLFFVLSGFLITSLLLGDRESPRYYRDFYWKRVLRILPLYLVCIVVMYAVQRNLAAVFFAAFFVANFASVLHVPMFGPFWSLAIEEQFYLLWPTVVRRIAVRHLRLCAITVGVASVLMRCYAASRAHHNYHISFLRIDGLAFGACMGVIYRMHEKTAALRSRHTKWFVAGLLLSLVGFVGRSHWSQWSDAWVNCLQQTAATLFSGCTVGLAVLHAGASWLGWLRARVFIFLGLISYALYMIHDAVLALYDHVWGTPTPAHVGGLWLRFFVIFATSVLLSLASRYAIELPALSLRRYVLPHPHQQTTGEPPLPLAQQ